MRRLPILAAAALAAGAITAPAATAGTYTFKVVDLSALVVGPEAGSSPAFRILTDGKLATHTSATPPYATGAWARAWLALPAGAWFRQVGGRVFSGGGNVNPKGLDTAVVLHVRDDLTTTAWQATMTPAYGFWDWSYDGTTTFPDRVGEQIVATADSACGPCVFGLEDLGGTIDDSQPPSSVTISSTIPSPFVTSRDVPVSYSVTDLASGPAAATATVNGIRQPTPLFAATHPDTHYLTGQSTAGSSVASGDGIVTLPDFDGSYAIRVVGADGVGNENTSTSAVNVVLDRTAPSVAITGPGGWCSTNCTLDLSVVDDVAGIANITATDGPTGIPIEPLLPGSNTVALTLHLDPYTTEGRNDIEIVAVDRAGNTTTKHLAITIDTVPPAVSAATGEPTDRTLHLEVQDISPLKTATAQIAGRTIPLTTIDPTATGLRAYTATLPTSGLPVTLDGATTEVTLTDFAGNTTRTNVVFRSRPTPQLTARASAKVLGPGAALTISGTLAATGLGGGVPVDVIFENTDWPGYNQTWTTTTTDAGAINLTIHPRISGNLRLRYAGSTDAQPRELSLGTVTVRPTITARFSYRRLSGGRIGRITVTGRFGPAGGPRVTLVWQARSPRSSAWFNVCQAGDEIHVTGAGGFHGRCRLAGLPAGVRLRLAYVGGAGQSYAAAVSRGSRLG